MALPAPFDWNQPITENIELDAIYRLKPSTMVNFASTEIIDYMDLEELPDLYTSMAIDPALTDFTGAFKGMMILKTFYLFDVSHGTNFTEFLAQCPDLTTVPLLNLANATNTSKMFYGDTKLTNVPAFNLKNVTNASGMFQNCGLTSVPAFNITKCQDFSNMFNGCPITSVVGSINLQCATNVDGMFSGANLGSSKVTFINKPTGLSFTNIGITDTNYTISSTIDTAKDPSSV